MCKRKAAGCKIGTMIKMIDYSENVIDTTFNNVAYLAKCSTPEHITYCKEEARLRFCQGQVLMAVSLLSDHSDSTARVRLESI